MDDVLYTNRLLTEGHPELERRAAARFSETQEAGDERAALTRRVVSYLARLKRIDPPAAFLVVGCGPKPRTCAELLSMGHAVTALEPVPAFAAEAQQYLGAGACVVGGAAEEMAVPTASQDVVLCESILEHVESPRLSLTEIHRVLKPGGVVWITTTNRWDFSLTGRNGEYNFPFFNWLPPVFQEAYVHHHLHFDPSLANYSLRPAVHWFTYADLCRRGRDVGFRRFYSILDVVELTDPTIASSRFRRSVLRLVQRRPLFRALALTQVGHTMIMVKP
jgi:2-polyprenyl-6-hydroxyphenyl methylase/3-demethylubiquinone-9 3-methyltransferase